MNLASWKKLESDSGEDIVSKLRRHARICVGMFETARMLEAADEIERLRRKNLFALTNFVSSAGIPLKWKIDCDALTDWDIETIAFVISEKFKFRAVYGVPTGGIRLSKALEKYRTEGRFLIVDDVFTTGKTMENARTDEDDIGVVIVARGKCPSWITPVFTLAEKFMLEG